MWANPTAPNVPDFNTFVLNQGVPSADLPSGTLTAVSIDASGNLSASSSTGTIAVGMALIGTGINTYIATWNSGTNSGTVSPAPSFAVSAASATTYSPYLAWAFSVAIDIALAPPPGMPALMYVLAVYNLGMHQLLKIGQDQSGQTFFADQRKAFNLLTFQAGPVASSADQSTSETLVTADFIKGLTMQGLDQLNTPWGREYLAYAQMYGPSIVEVS
jgi:hypothetical protein